MLPIEQVMNDAIAEEMAKLSDAELVQVAECRLHAWHLPPEIAAKFAAAPRAKLNMPSSASVVSAPAGEDSGEGRRMNFPESLAKAVLVFPADRFGIMERWLAAWSQLGFRAPEEFSLREGWNAAEMVVRRDNCGSLRRAPWATLESSENLAALCGDLELGLAGAAAFPGTAGA